MPCLREKCALVCHFLEKKNMIFVVQFLLDLDIVESNCNYFLLA